MPLPPTRALPQHLTTRSFASECPTSVNPTAGNPTSTAGDIDRLDPATLFAPGRVSEAVVDSRERLFVTANISGATNGRRHNELLHPQALQLTATTNFEHGWDGEYEDALESAPPRSTVNKNERLGRLGRPLDSSGGWISGGQAYTSTTVDESRAASTSTNTWGADATTQAFPRARGRVEQCKVLNLRKDLSKIPNCHLCDGSEPWFTEQFEWDEIVESTNMTVFGNESFRPLQVGLMHYRTLDTTRKKLSMLPSVDVMCL